MKHLTPERIEELAIEHGYEPAALRAVIQVETGGRGFDTTTGKLLIQFEPSWFRRLLPKPILAAINAAAAVEKTAPAKLTPEQRSLLERWRITQANGVEGQLREWPAFNAAFAIDKQAAMLSTSWGLPQMMGFNHRAAGYATVGAMIDAFKESEANQLRGMLGFIKANKRMSSALKAKDWGVLAYYYNGAGYKQFRYDTRLEAAYARLAKSK